MTRRDFILMSAAAAASAGCQGVGGASASGGERVVDAGSVANYSKDGVYPNFCDAGFFIIRRGQKLEALSSICTHRKCTVTAESDQSFYCHCHGSTFDPTGKVTEGPAKRDLPVLVTFTSEAGHFMVKVPS